MRRYTQEALDSLAKSSEITTVNGQDVLLKRSDRGEVAHIDYYEANYQNTDLVSLPEGEPASPAEAVDRFRMLFGCHNYNLNEREIYTKYEVLEVSGRKVGLWRYYLRHRAKSSRSCLIYIHGGGWVAGSTYTVENPCKLIAELADAVVFNIDYSLAPEAKYPAAVEELWTALKHIYDNAEAYGIDPQRIMVAGDSAGGNLTAVLALRDRDERTHMIARQFMLYPAVILGKTVPEGYIWSESAYDISSQERERVLPALGLGRHKDGEAQDGMLQFYVSDPEMAKEPYVSPALAGSFKGLAPAIIATAEYDGLRIQGEYYGHQLAQAGVPVRVLRYTGCFHAFFDRLGYVPQSEDVCREIAEELMRISTEQSLEEKKEHRC